MVSIPIICITLGFMRDGRGVCIGFEGLEPSPTMVNRDVLSSRNKFVKNFERVAEESLGKFENCEG